MGERKMSNLPVKFPLPLSIYGHFGYFNYVSNLDNFTFKRSDSEKFENENLNRTVKLGNYLG
jgi:hypothetical protein